MILADGKILRTDKTPEIIFNQNGIITIKGRWPVDNNAEFSKALSDWFDSYIFNSTEIVAINISLEYTNGFNSATLISLLRKILFIKLSGNKLIINWLYEEGDEDIYSLGEYVSDILETPFTFKMSSFNKPVLEYSNVQLKKAI